MSSLIGTWGYATEYYGSWWGIMWLCLDLNMDLKEWIWDESVWKVALFELRGKWWYLRKKFVSDMIGVNGILIFLFDKFVRLKFAIVVKIIENEIWLICWVWLMNYYFLVDGIIRLSLFWNKNKKYILNYYC